MDAETTGGTDFGGWLMGVGDKLLTASIDAKVNNPQKIEELKINKLGTLGYYSEGQLNMAGPLGLPPVVLLLGAGLLVYLLVKG